MSDRVILCFRLCVWRASWIGLFREIGGVAAVAHGAYCCPAWLRWFHERYRSGIRLVGRCAYSCSVYRMERVAEDLSGYGGWPDRCAAGSESAGASAHIRQSAFLTAQPDSGRALLP